MEMPKLEPVAMPELSVCSGCLGPRRWEFHYKCDGVACPLGFKQDYSANYLVEHYHYRCGGCGRSIASNRTP